MSIKASDGDDLLIGLKQHLFGARQAEMTEFFHRRSDVVFAEGFFEAVARHGDVFDHVGHADLLVGVVVDEAKCSDDAGMVNGEAVCAAPFTGQDCVVCPRTVRAEVIAVASMRDQTGFPVMVVGGHQRQRVLMDPSKS